MTSERPSPELQRRIEALPRDIEPSRDLWKGIERAITDDKVVRPDFAAGAAQPSAARAFDVDWRRIGRVAAAAALLVAVSSGLTAYLLGPATQSSTSLSAERAQVEAIAWNGFLSAEHEYQQVTAALLDQLDAQRDELAPETVEIVERNLRLIDTAIAEARAALEQDPANAKLVNKVAGMYRTKVRFLRDMSRL